MKSKLRPVIILLCLLMLALPALAQESAEANRAIALVENQPDFATMLAEHDSYRAEAWLLEEEQAGDSLWEVEFFVDEGEDMTWLGWALVDVASGEILEQFVPRFISAEEINALAPRLREIALGDPEIAQVVTNPAEWQIGVEHNPYENLWEVYFGRGLDFWTVLIYQNAYDETEMVAKSEAEFEVVAVINETALQEQEADAQRRTDAIMLAFEAPGAEAALSRADDDWTTYVQPLDASRYTVEFVTTERLFCVVVDVEAQRVDSPC